MWVNPTICVHWQGPWSKPNKPLEATLMRLGKSLLSPSLSNTNPDRIPVYFSVLMGVEERAITHTSTMPILSMKGMSWKTSISQLPDSILYAPGRYWGPKRLVTKPAEGFGVFKIQSPWIFTWMLKCGSYRWLVSIRSEVTYLKLALTK